ncbi:hypothetical protein A9Q86_09420 [Flavobacteriales bacterium 33_180_T64]|nr:hypothetical protein A9Q86_09420 [Flavobacteriales bacterium 33_180_T64]
MKKKYKTLLCFILALSILPLVFFISKTNSIGQEIYVEVYEKKGGYGYKISISEKIVIQQDHIPAIQKQIVFKNYNDALLIANLVKSKLESNKNPRITIDDLNSNNVEYNEFK